MLKKIIVICESFNESRFLPHKKISEKIIFIKVNDIKNNLLKIFSVFTQIINCFFVDGHIIIAPLLLSPLIIFYLPLKWVKRENISLDTSYVRWKEDKYSIELGPLKPILKFLWFSFIKDLKIRAVNKPAYNFLKKYTDKIALIPHSVDNNIFYRNKKIKKNKKFTVLFVGKIEYKKGVDLILAAAKRLPEIDFWLVGKGDYEETVKSANLKNIKMFGLIEDKNKLNEIYNKCHCLVLPSRKYKNWEELFGIVLIEAMTCKLPVIATKCIGPKEIIENNKDGFLVDINDINEITEKIKILRENRKLANKLGESGYSKIKHKYNIELISSNIFNLLKSD